MFKDSLILGVILFTVLLSIAPAIHANKKFIVKTTVITVAQVINDESNTTTGVICNKDSILNYNKERKSKTCR